MNYPYNSFKYCILIGAILCLFSFQEKTISPDSLLNLYIKKGKELIQSNQDSAISYTHTGVDYFKENGFIRQEIVLAAELAKHYLHIGEKENGLEILDYYWKKSVEEDSLYIQGLALRKGLIFEDNGQLDSAYIYYKIYKDYAVDEKMKAYALLGLIDVVSSLELPEETEVYLKEINPLIDKLPKVDQSVILFTLMGCTQRYGLRRYYSQFSEQYFKLMNIKTVEQFKSYHGGYFIKEENVSDEEHIAFFKEIIQENIKNNYVQGFGVHLTYLADILKKTPKELVKSMEQYSKFEIFEKVSLKSKISIYKYYCDALRKTKLYKEAYDVSEKIRILEKDLSRKENAAQVIKLEKKYESERKNKVIAEQNVKLNNHIYQRNLMIGGTILTLMAMAILLVRGYFRKKLFHFKMKNFEKEKKILAMDFILQGQEEERKRIARDLHDGLGGLLASAKMQLEKVESEIGILKDMSIMNNAQGIIDNAYKEVRRISHDMMPADLLEFGFKESVLNFIEKINIKKGLLIDAQFFSDGDKLNDNHALVLYRILQELINNVLKHSQASQVIIQFSENSSSYLLTVEDDGIGFEKDKVKHGLGLQNIHSRVKYLNGKLNFYSKTNEGVSYEISIPKS